MPKTRIEAAIENIYETQCPGEWFPGEPKADKDTFVPKANPVAFGGHFTPSCPQGCRGISCKECWGAEMLPDGDDE